MARMQPEDEPEPVSPDEFDHYLNEGVDLFNSARYHEAHEAFERVWVSVQGDESEFYKGLIQASICLHHFQRENLDGAAKLYSGHRKLLAAFLPHHQGIDVEGFLGEMQRALRPVLRRKPGDEVKLVDGPRLARIDA